MHVYSKKYTYILFIWRLFENDRAADYQPETVSQISLLLSLFCTEPCSLESFDKTPTLRVFAHNITSPPLVKLLSDLTGFREANNRSL